MVCCPMTTRAKGYPFEVDITGNQPGVVLADQVKSLDWRVRQATRKGQASDVELADVRARVFALTSVTTDSRSLAIAV